jgi:enoyl-CoA hydratase/carnithine racemase
MSTNQPTMDRVAVERYDAITVIQIDAPPLNLLTQHLRKAITHAVTAADADPDVRAVVLSGGLNFCAGADLKEFALRRDRAVAQEHCRNGHGMTMRAVSCSKPIIAAIEGACLGGGFELALACDIRIAASNARFGLPEVNRGAFPGTGGLYLLRRLVGPARTKQLAYSGMIVDAKSGEMDGVIDQVTKPGTALKTALQTAQAIAKQPAGSIRTIKHLVDHDFVTGLAEYLSAEEQAYVTCYQTRDAVEGWNSFLEKRSPIWRHN